MEWILFNCVILGLLFLELYVHRKSGEIQVKTAACWTAFWISLALLFNLYIYWSRGPIDALNFLTGYLIEESLSIDNLFVFLLIFKYFRTPSSSKHKVLFYGVVSAIVMRAAFIWLGILLISKFHWMIYLFGLFLIYTGIKLGLEKDKEVQPEKNPLLKLLRRFFPVTDNYVKDKFFILKEGKYWATPLLVVLIAIETTDLIFAMDSIPAILAITYDPFIVYTSNILAVMGLRSLFFVLSNVMDLFHFLHYALAFILVFIGIKMVLSEIFPIPTLMALSVVFGALALSIIASLIFPAEHPKS